LRVWPIYLSQPTPQTIMEIRHRLDAQDAPIDGRPQ
jgi:hypothetical protein